MTKHQSPENKKNFLPKTNKIRIKATAIVYTPQLSDEERNLISEISEIYQQKASEIQKMLTDHKLLNEKLQLFEKEIQNCNQKKKKKKKGKWQWIDV